MPIEDAKCSAACQDCGIRPGEPDEDERRAAETYRR
jgi:hypothetical protein